MPYLGTPPEPPPTIVHPPVEEISHSQPSPVAVSESASPKPLKSDSPPPETAEFCPEPSLTYLLKDDFLRKGGESRADLLGGASPVGLVPLSPQTEDAEQLPSPIAYKVKADVKFNGKLTPLNPVPKPYLAQSNSDSDKPSNPDEVYSLSGVSKSAPQDGEQELMDGLSQAIVVDKLSADLGSSGLTIDTDKMRLNLLTQQPETPPEEPAQPFYLPIPSRDRRPLQEDSGPVFSFPQTVPGKRKPETPPQAPPPKGTPKVVELTADRQEYDQNRKVFTAEGKVTMRFENGLLDADRLQVNLNNQIAVAEGNVALTRGGQVLRGQRMEYNFVQGVGTILNARGDINIEQFSSDFATAVPSDVGAASIGRPVSDRVTSAQPLRVNSTGGASFGAGVGRDVGRVPGALPRGGQVRRLRFQAEKIDFTPEGWVAKNIQITNDPFSPPQLVLKAEQATLTRLSPLRDELVASRPRLVFDQRVSIPLPLNRTIIDRNERQPALFQFGYDGEDRGGLFVQRRNEFRLAPNLFLTVIPQIYLQRMVFDSNGPFDPSNYGGIVRFTYLAGPTTRIRGFASLTSFDVKDYNDNLRASIRGTQLIGTHTLALEYSFRDRLFNGSLGFQTVQRSVGAVLLSPRIELGKTGIVLNYQTGVQYITARTDDLKLLGQNPKDDLVSLGRFQASAGVTRGFNFWSGKPLPATPEEGLKYTATPIVPYVSMGVGLTGVTSAYSDGSNQSNIFGSVGLYGQFGHFSKPFLDYTAFSLTYIRGVNLSGESPFFFDRAVDNQVLVIGLTQQLYGPIRLTVQTSFNVASGQELSTDLILEYSRRAYGIILRYNPVLEIGSLNLRISEFNWVGGTQPFEGIDVTPVEGAIRRTDNW